MRPVGSAEELERRRLRAVDLLGKGQGPTEVARMVGANRRSVQRWARRSERGGTAALAPKRHPGPPGKLDVAQRRRLGAALLEGPKAQGFATDLWTGPRVAQLVRRMFGVRYNPKYVPRLLRSLGWTPQRPEGRAYERDEKAIARWVRDEWPRIKKRQSARRAPRVPG